MTSIHEEEEYVSEIHIEQYRLRSTTPFFIMEESAKIGPDLIPAVKIVLKYEIQSLLARLSDTGEEYLVLTASSDEKTCGHLSSTKGETFIKKSSFQLMKQDFLKFCSGQSTKAKDIPEDSYTISPDLFLAYNGLQMSTPHCSSLESSYSNCQGMDKNTSFSPGGSDLWNNSKKNYSTTTISDLTSQIKQGTVETDVRTKPADSDCGCCTIDVKSKSSVPDKEDMVLMDIKTEPADSEYYSCSVDKSTSPLPDREDVVGREIKTEPLDCVSYTRYLTNTSNLSMEHDLASNQHIHTSAYMGKEEVHSSNENENSDDEDAALQEFLEPKQGKKRTLQDSKPKQEKKRAFQDSSLTSDCFKAKSVTENSETYMTAAQHRYTKRRRHTFEQSLNPKAGKESLNPKAGKESLHPKAGKQSLNSKAGTEVISSNSFIGNSSRERASSRHITGMDTSFFVIGDAAKCLLCNAVLKNKCQRTIHLQSHASSNKRISDVKLRHKNSPVACEFCGRKIKDKEMLHLHMSRFHGVGHTDA